MYIFGGSSYDVVPLNDLWEFDTIEIKWKKLGPFGNEKCWPAPRSGHTIVGDPNFLRNHPSTTNDQTNNNKNNNSNIRSRFLLYGGGQWNRRSWTSPFTDLHEYDVESGCWKNIVPIGKVIPDTNTFCGAVLVFNSLYLFGGGSNSNGNISPSVWRMDLIQKTWSLIPNLKADRDSFQLALFNDFRCFLVGGHVGWANDDWRTAPQEIIFEYARNLLKIYQQSNQLLKFI